MDKEEKIGDARRRVAENVRRLRKERGLSQEEMAELANFHRTYVSQLERCVTNISVGGLEKLAQALGVDILDLLAKIDKPTEQAEKISLQNRSHYAK